MSNEEEAVKLPAYCKHTPRARYVPKERRHV